MASIRDVANRAGVSIATVSHVLNNTKRVSEDVRRRVLAAVEELGYRPNLIGRSLRTRKTSTIALIIPDISAPFFPEVALGVEEYCGTRDYTVLLGNAHEDPAAMRKYVKVMLDRGVDGLLLVPSGDIGIDELCAWRAQVPLVVIDRRVPDAPFLSQVYSDNAGGAAEATRHLLELGHRRIALLMGVSGVHSYQDRLSGYLQALRAAGIPVDRSLIARARSTPEAAEAVVRDLLARKDGPTAIFCTSSSMIVGVLRAVRAAGLSYPKNISLIDFDDLVIDRSVSPGITAVRQDPYKIGQIAAAQVLAEVRGDRGPRTTVIPAPLVVRESTQAPHA